MLLIFLFALAGEVEHENAIRKRDLIGRQADPFGGVHELEHFAHDLTQLGCDLRDGN